MGWGAPAKCRLVSTVKQTGHESGCQLIPQTYRGFAPGPYWGGLPSPDPLGYSPQMKIPGVATEPGRNMFYGEPQK